MNRHTQRMNTEGVSILEMLMYQIQEHKRVKKIETPGYESIWGFLIWVYRIAAIAGGCNPPLF